jgi:hypothetical protein
MSGLLSVEALALIRFNLAISHKIGSLEVFEDLFFDRFLADWTAMPHLEVVC